MSYVMLLDNFTKREVGGSFIDVKKTLDLKFRFDALLIQRSNYLRFHPVYREWLGHYSDFARSMVSEGRESKAFCIL